jgi:diguanylate cyclase (GGDEF)-like protein
MNDTVNNDDMKGKWYMILWKMFFVIAIIFSLIEVLLFFSFTKKAEHSMTYEAYILSRIVVPVFIYFISLLVSYYLLKAKKLEEWKNEWVISVLIFIVLVTFSLEHYLLLPIIFLPLIAVVATAIFANTGITITLTLLNIAAIVINNVRLFHISEWKGFNFVGNMAVAILIALGFCVITVVLNMYNNELVESINDTNVKQMNLMTELKKDPLTGLYNRRSFEESLEAEILRTEETGEKAYIAIFDIDHFKNVNDTYGHSNGDVVIKALCKMLKEKSKDSGLAFRYGGEEFVILFSDVDLSKVINVVEDVRTEFRCYYFQFMNNSGITCSCGIAEYAAGESSKAWFNRADSSLYKAKEAGRNRTVVSE